MTDTISRPPSDTTDRPVGADEARRRERKGRAWLLWSFIVCPCHLPLTIGVLGALFGGSAFGAIITRNPIGVGVVFGLLYLAGLVVAFRHLRSAAADRSCEDGACLIEQREPESS